MHLRLTSSSDTPSPDWTCPDAPPLLPRKVVERLLTNGRWIAAASDDDIEPVIKRFTPDAACTWLLVSLDPRDPGLAHGLCDLGLGHPELGSLRINEIAAVCGAFGLPPERDLHVRAEGPVSWYAEMARRFGATHA